MRKSYSKGLVFFKEAQEETRLEYEIARTMPSLAFLKRLAAVLDASLQVQFKFQ